MTDIGDVFLCKNRRFYTKTAPSPNCTYSEWIQNITPQQKQALELARRKDTNRTADKLLHEKYKKLLGTKEVPKSFGDFQKMKYAEPDKWDELKRLYRYENKPYLQERLDYIYEGQENFIPNKTLFEATKTIAGQGSKTEIRDVPRLCAQHGGEASEWKKRVGKIESAKYIFDVHWYERSGVQYEARVVKRIKKEL